MLAAGFWFVTTAIDLAVGSTLLRAPSGYDVPLTDWPVLRSVLMNLLAYVIWAVLGVGLGVLIRSQLGATLTGAALYLLSYAGRVRALRHRSAQYVIKEDWVLERHGRRARASPPRSWSRRSRSSSGSPAPTAPAWWVGALVLVGYGVVAGVSAP